MSAPTFIDTLRVTVATMQAQYPAKADAISRAHAAIVEGHVVAQGDGTGRVLSRNGHVWYTTNSHCDCTAGHFQKQCRHLEAWKLYQYVQRKLDAQAPTLAQAPPLSPSSSVDTPTALPAALVGVDPKYIVLIQYKPFARFAGLLDLAHRRGLQSLEATFTYNDLELSLAQATAVFPFGTFTDVGDASPGNTNPKVRAHFRRVAATRASARALRLALNVSQVAVEELGQEEIE